MKKVIEKFYRIIRFIVTIFASREFGFIYCLFGTIGQVTHTWFLVNNISSFSGNFQTIQAMLISVFISSSLLYFVAISDNMDSSKEAKKIRLATNIFMIIEILINIYYYTRHLIIDSAEMQLFDFFFAVVVSGLLPITIKLYGGLIRAKEWMGELKTKDAEELPITEEELMKKVIDYLNQYTLSLSQPENINNKEVEEKILNNLTAFKDDLVQNYDSNISKIFNDKFTIFKEDLMKNYDLSITNMFQEKFNLFLQQFENKCKMIQSQKLNELSNYPILKNTFLDTQK
jgi:hypothetical protein